MEIKGRNPNIAIFCSFCFLVNISSDIPPSPFSSLKKI